MWRFTLVARDSKITKQGIKETQTHPQRYTYLVEKDRPNRTMAERMEVLSLAPEKNLQTLIDAFSVEKLSKAFFDEYKEHYQRFVEYLTGKRMVKNGSRWEEKQTSQPSPFLKSVFNGDEKKARDFIKKLMGRIIFLYFVQKKRWLGATTTEYKDGPHDFIYQLFKKTGGNEAFFPFALSALFFEALNKQRPNDDWQTPWGETVKIPFLNGGLFVRDEMDEIIHRKGDMLTFPPKLFADIEKMEQPEDRGFLDFLNAYNFTVYEDSPDDHTVAVDPEMLGHIFENLLEDNKDKGAFYTPKEIVHYMCQESLTEYLKNSPPKEGGQTSSGGVVKRASQNYFSLPYNPKLKEYAKALRKAGNLAEVLFWNRVKNKQFKGFDFDRQKIIGNYIVDFYCGNCNVVIEIDGSSHNDKVEYDAERDAYLQSLGLTTIHIRAEEVLKNLDAVMEMLFDHPALSGTPPTEGDEPPLAPPTEGNFGQGVERLIKYKDASLLSEHQLRYIDGKLNAVKICDPAIGSGAFPMGLLQEIHAIKEVIAYELRQPWNPAEVKENIIQNSIYGVDIEKGAVDIARLRFWLSLVVDEEKPKALPNLDYKIVVGNSLVSKFEDEVIEIDWEIKEGTQGHLFGNENVLRRQALLKKITEKQRDYFHATEKQQLADEIRNLKIDILINQLELMIKTKGLENKPTQSGRKVSALMELWLQTQGWKNAIAKLQKLKQNKEAPFKHFDWKLDFPEVLNPYLVNDDGGFDIVIGNPPYISTKGVDSETKKQFEKHYGFADDTYNHFFFKSFELLKHKGILAFITSKTFWTIQTKKNLRHLLLNNTLLTLFDTANPFENAMVDTCVAIAQKNKAHHQHTVLFLDGKKDLQNPEKFTIPQADYANAPNQVFFIPTDFNKKIYKHLGTKVNELLNQWWDKISTSKNIEKHKRELENYRKSLKPGHITLLGLITEGGVGIQTGNNGKYIGVLEGTKWADNVRKQRPVKLLLATQFCKTKNIKNKADAQTFLHNLNEKEIHQLFDDLKEQYGRDVFGQGWLYRIVSPDEIADVDTILPITKNLTELQAKKPLSLTTKATKTATAGMPPHLTILTGAGKM
ncbi:MAG: hypothetical protein KatS3mg031_1897 [Chitinophagales bacterium]|nr:MAG: hypothetical protein KatS3mg031_1897 [Chitinophagales bacterium]